MLAQEKLKSQNALIMSLVGLWAVRGTAPIAILSSLGCRLQTRHPSYSNEYYV